MGTEGGKRLSELRVCDLKLELEKRSLETTGVKMDLVKRLQEVSSIEIFLSIHSFIDVNFELDDSVFSHFVVKDIFY